jgi:L-alanine-DL-glutamate epimerase-like enolase superfamily enzyme
VNALSGPLVVESLVARPLSVALVEPFVIASGRVDVTRAVEVEARVRWRGRAAVGLGEAACLPPVTREDQPDVLREIEQAGSLWRAQTLDASAIETLPGLGPVARAGVETALLDALARIAGVPLRTLLGGPTGAATTALETDVTIAIAEPERMARLAREWVARGFGALKVKVGKDLHADAAALESIARAAPGARLRVDANGGYAADDAIALARECERMHLAVECWEQPCAAEDLDGMARVAAALTTPVVADESVRRVEDVAAVAAARAADGVNLKLAKLGGLLPARRAGLDARSRGMSLMVGGMVETRLGMTAAAHLACSLGGAEFVDLDTAWLLAADPYRGGYEARGPRYTMSDAPGLGVERSGDTATAT